VCRDSGGRLLGLGLVSLHDADAARKQMDQSAASDMVRDIAVPPLLGTGSFDAAPMHEVLAIAAERDLGVLVHPMQLPRPEWSSYYLTNLVGSPVEPTTAAASLVLGGVLEELPALRICLLHGGGCAPALVGRWQHGWERRADVRSAGTRSPREGFAALWFDTLTHDAFTLELLRAHADPSRLMRGGDYPFDMGVTRLLELPRAEGIDDEVPERNARRFLGL
jgi:aminocarboxymuconate-semialdehyde decarboxylase